MEDTIGDTIKSVLKQSYENFEIIVQDNASTDKTHRIVKSFLSPKIHFHKNKTNLGYAKNISTGFSNANGQIVLLLGADDILSSSALSDYNDAFNLDPDVGAVTRPYYWFQNDISQPIRVTPRIKSDCNEVISIKNIDKAILVLHNEILGQLSGLAFRKEYIESSYFTEHNDWIAHGYPFLNVFKKHKVVFLKEIPVAIRIGANTIRVKGNNLYDISPTQRWIEMLDEVFYEKKHKELKKQFLQKIIGSNYIGLVQIKCYSSANNLIREIRYLLKLNPHNIYNLKFLFYSLICIFTPSSILSVTVDFYKNKINSKGLGCIRFPY